ncbi:MAG: PhoD-like phosphatase N-terminal domain-containing protein, partial [Aphanizomenon sp.]
MITISATDANAAELGGDTGSFRITRTGVTTNALTVNYTVKTGTGQATSSDYKPNLSGSIAIAAGQSFADILITPVDDPTVEGSETVTITLVDTANYDLGTTATAAINITDSNVNPLGFSGVAAGDVTSHDVILWTRTFDSVTKKGDNANLVAQVSTDPSFGVIAFTYNVSGANDGLDRDGTIKLNATGLQSGTKYYYRFQSAAGNFSNVGTFKTAPESNIEASVRFGFSGDVDGLMRPYTSTQSFNSLNLDFFGFLGDTMYATASTGSPAAANPVINPTQALSDYHRKYLENIQPVSNGGFAGLETMFISQANYTALDNHELGNKQLINGGAPGALATASGNGSSNITDDVNTTGAFINQTVGFK